MFSAFPGLLLSWGYGFACLMPMLFRMIHTCFIVYSFPHSFLTIFMTRAVVYWPWITSSFNAAFWSRDIFDGPFLGYLGIRLLYPSCSNLDRIAIMPVSYEKKLLQDPCVSFNNFRYLSSHNWNTHPCKVRTHISTCIRNFFKRAGAG